jgi:hypothetical protein
MKPASEGGSRAVEGGRKDKSGQRKKVRERGELTLCRPTRVKQVRAAKNARGRGAHALSSATREISKGSKKSQQVRSTHQLLSAEGETCYDSKENPESEGHSHTVEHRGRDKSGQQKRSSGQGALTDCQMQRGE